MKKNFITGLAILLPMTLTLVIASFVVNIITKPFLGFVEPIQNYFGLFDEPFLFWSAGEVLQFGSKFLVLLFLLILTVVIGLLARHFFLNSAMKMADYVLHRIPVISKIYKTSQDIVRTVLSPDSRTFSDVVLAPFPHLKGYSLGLVSREHVPEGSDPIHEDTITVFVPGTPNPAMGFMLLYKEKDLIYLDMRVEEAMKFIISCGVMETGLSVRTNRHPQTEGQTSTNIHGNQSVAGQEIQ